MKVEKKVEKKAVVKVEVKKGDNRYSILGLKGQNHTVVDFRDLLYHQSALPKEQ